MAQYQPSQRAPFPSGIPQGFVPGRGPQQSFRAPSMPPELERGGANQFAPTTTAPNYMQYSMGGAYDDGDYSQFLSADYGLGVESPMPPRSGPEMRSRPYPDAMAGGYDAALLDGITGGRTPDTGTAIRPGGSRPGGRPPNAGMSPDPLGPRPVSDQGPHSSGFEVIGGNDEVAPRAELKVVPPEQKPGSYYVCPVCSSLAVRVEDSLTREAMCSNGHMWRLENGTLMIRK